MINHTKEEQRQQRHQRQQAFEKHHIPQWNEELRWVWLSNHKQEEYFHVSVAASSATTTEEERS